MDELTEDEIAERARLVMGAYADREREVQRNMVIFDTLALCVWPSMQVHHLNSCITASRVCFDILREYNIRTRAVAAQVRVFNAPMYARMRRGEVPTDVSEVECWQKQDGSWNVGIGGFGYDQDGRFDGHLVVVADSAVLLDPSLPQVNRPEHAVELCGTAGRVPDGWPHTVADPIQVEVGGCLVVYQAIRDDDRRWVATPSWRDSEMREPVVRFLRGALASALADL